MAKWPIITRNMSGEIPVRTVKIEIACGKKVETITIEFDFKTAKITSSNGSTKTFNLEYFWDQRAYKAVGRILFDDILDFLELGRIEEESRAGDEDC